MAKFRCIYLDSEWMCVARRTRMGEAQIIAGWRERLRESLRAGLTADAIRHWDLGNPFRSEDAHLLLLNMALNSVERRHAKADMEQVA